MYKYVKCNPDSGLCTEVGTGTNIEFYKSIGMTLQDVDQSEVDGQWYLDDKCPHYSVPEKLHNAKVEKLAQLAFQTAQFENNLNKDMYFVSSLGFRVNGDRRTRSNIEDLIAFAQTFPVAYRDYDNVMRDVTENELRTMLVEHITNGNNLYQTKWLLESQIQECTTIEEVNAIEIKFEMMDFSNNEPEETE